MVDACRNNLRPKKQGRSVGSSRGLSAIEPPKGQMVVYSASKGQTAMDALSEKDKNSNSVFTREFVARMKRPGLRIEDLVREVQDAVDALAGTVQHEQRPALYNEARRSIRRQTHGAPRDGSAGVNRGDQARRVLRGGAWNDIPRSLRSANRIHHAPDFRVNYAGMRVARTL